MTLYTIGFTKKSAQTFFTTLRQSGARRLIDVRLNNVSQLAGFAKRDDLRFFLETICNMEYAHTPTLAPTQNILDAYKKKRGVWSHYEQQFLTLMRERRIESTLDPATLDGACLLCSEEKPHHCHRRLVAEYLQRHWHAVQITHLG